MRFENLKFVDEDHEQISAIVDGRATAFQADVADRHYCKVIADRLVVANYQAPAPHVDDVLAECRRRKLLAADAESDAAFERAKERAVRESVKLLHRKKNETPRGNALAALNDALEAIDAAADVLLEADPIPADYADDKHWPPVP
jgi:hypothetical protein